jgi:hypothetical protein
VNPIIIIAGVFLFASSILLGRQSESPEAKIFTTKTTSEASDPTATPEQTHASSQPEQTTTTPAKTPNPGNKNKPNSITNVPLADFKYPDSQVISDTTNTIVLRSADSPQKITSWYENRMQELGYSSRASAKTNTNGNVKNKLGGGKNTSNVTIENVTIEIVKNANEAVTTITLSEGRDSDSDVHIKIENNEPYL